MSSLSRMLAVLDLFTEEKPTHTAEDIAGRLERAVLEQTRAVL